MAVRFMPTPSRCCTDEEKERERTCARAFAVIRLNKNQIIVAQFYFHITIIHVINCSVEIVIDLCALCQPPAVMHLDSRPLERCSTWYRLRKSRSNATATNRIHISFQLKCHKHASLNWLCAGSSWAAVNKRMRKKQINCACPVAAIRVHSPKTNEPYMYECDQCTNVSSRFVRV